MKPSRLETVILDLTQIQVGDNGNTSYYGGFYTIKGTVGGVKVYGRYDGYGNDRGNNHQDEIISNLEKFGVIFEDVKLENECGILDDIYDEREYTLYLDTGG